MNNNFEYLDDRITDVGSSITTVQSNLASVSANLSNKINNLNYATPEDLENEVGTINDAIDALEGKVNEMSFLPDYTKAFSIPSPYTATMDGYVYAYAWCASGTEGASMYIDDFQIILNGGLNNREGAHGPSALAPISKGSTFTTSGNIQTRTFIPMKGSVNND